MEMNDQMNHLRKHRKVQDFIKIKVWQFALRQNLEETWLLSRWWTVQRWHEHNIDIYMERENLKTDVKGVYQVSKLQDNSTDVVIGADWVVVVKKFL